MIRYDEIKKEITLPAEEVISFRTYSQYEEPGVDLVFVYDEISFDFQLHDWKKTDFGWCKETIDEAERRLINNLMLKRLGLQHLIVAPDYIKSLEHLLKVYRELIPKEYNLE